MRRFTLFLITALAVAQLSGCIVSDTTVKRSRPKVEKAPRKAKKEKKNGKKNGKKTTRPKTDGNTGASRRF